MSLRRAGIGSAVGIVLGVAVAGIWWWGWGCRVCAPGSTPATFVAFGAGLGALLGAWLGADGPPVSD